MTQPKRPYLLRALHEWVIDNNLTPYVMVEVDGPDVVVPSEYVENGRIVLNISHQAVRSLVIESDALSFTSRFSGTPFNVVVPMRSVLAIYAKETGEGMLFEKEYPVASTAADSPIGDTAAQPGAADRQQDISGGEDEKGRGGDDGQSPPERGSHLKVIK